MGLLDKALGGEGMKDLAKEAEKLTGLLDRLATAAEGIEAQLREYNRVARLAMGQLEEGLGNGKAEE